MHVTITCRHHIYILVWDLQLYVKPARTSTNLSCLLSDAFYLASYLKLFINFW